MRLSATAEKLAEERKDVIAHDRYLLVALFPVEGSEHLLGIILL